MKIINKVLLAGLLAFSLSTLVSADEFIYWNNMFDLHADQSVETSDTFYQDWWKHYSE